MYQLTEDDLDYSPDHDTPLIRAAAKRDSALLEALLVCYAASSAENTTERERQQVMAAPSLAAMGENVVKGWIRPFGVGEEVKGDIICDHHRQLRG